MLDKRFFFHVAAADAHKVDKNQQVLKVCCVNTQSCNFQVASAGIFSSKRDSKCAEVNVQVETHLRGAVSRANPLSSVRPGVPAVRSHEWRWARALRAAALALPSSKPGESDNTRTAPTQAEVKVELTACS